MLIGSLWASDHVARRGTLGAIGDKIDDIISFAKSFSGEPQPYSTTKIGVDILNKSGRTLWVAMANGSSWGDFNASLVAQKVKHKDFIQFPTDINQTTMIAIWLTDPKSISIERNVIIKGNWTFSPTPAAVYQIKPGKTIYISVYDDLSVKPQTGPNNGAHGKTRSGLSLANNISKLEKDSYITKIK